MPPEITLPSRVITALEVTETHGTFSGAQKYVFIATCKYGKCALKMHKSESIRDIRELDFYKNNPDIIGIPKIIDTFEVDNDLIVVEEWIEGEPLNLILTDFQKDYLKTKTLIEKICEILTPIWQQRIVHRDLKPENIIIRPNGTPVVIDFGIARNPDLTTITDTGWQPHTPLYAAPEQLLGKKDQISYRTDFFSIGIIAYHAYYGCPPFGETKDAIMAAFNGVLDFKLYKNDPMNSFFKKVLQISPSERPRNPKLFIGAL